MSDKKPGRGRVAWREDPAVWVALGRTIKVERTTRGWERKDLAERAGISYPYLSEIENGAKRASSKALGAIAEAFGLRVWELLERSESMSPRPETEVVAEMMASPAPASAPSWFHASAKQVRSQGARADRADLLRELLELLERLPTEDLERLRNLGRNLLGS